jgi:hypothetical protein
MPAIGSGPECLISFETLERYCMRRLDRAEEASISAHVSTCARCAEYLTELEGMNRVLRVAAEQSEVRVAQSSAGSIGSASESRVTPLTPDERESLYGEIRAMHAGFTAITQLMETRYGAHSSEARDAEQARAAILTFRRTLKYAVAVPP